MTWVEIFAVFAVSHLVGDFLLQTDWQATHKFGGLGPNRESRRALLSHTATYTLAFVPALIWLSTDIGAWAIGVALLIGTAAHDPGRRAPARHLHAPSQARHHGTAGGAAAGAGPDLSHGLPLRPRTARHRLSCLARLLATAAAAVALLALLVPAAGAAVKLKIPDAREKSARFAESTCTRDQRCVSHGVLNCRRHSLHIAFCRIFLKRHTPAQGKYTCDRLVRLSIDPKTHRIPVTGLGRWHC